MKLHKIGNIDTWLTYSLNMDNPIRNIWFMRKSEDSDYVHIPVAITSYEDESKTIIRDKYKETKTAKWVISLGYLCEFLNETDWEQLDLLK